jgi:hypothetical protein
MSDMERSQSPGDKEILKAAGKDLLAVGKGIAHGLKKISDALVDESDVQVKTYHTEFEMKMDVKKMIARGFRIEGQSGNINSWALVSMKRNITVTWVRDPRPEDDDGMEVVPFTFGLKKRPKKVEPSVTRKPNSKL